MNGSEKIDQLEFELLQILYPKSDNLPLPMPRVGKVGATPPIQLRQPGSEEPTGMRPPFHLVWEDPDLGVHIDFREVQSLTGPEIVAFVTGRSEDEGHSVVVALEADKQLKFLQRSVTLTLDKDQKSGGQVSFGRVADIVAKLGVSVVADAFLMERPTGTASKAKAQENGAELAPTKRIEQTESRSSAGVCLWIWSDEHKGWLLVLRPELFRRRAVMSNDAGDFEAEIDSPPPVHDSCSWAEALKIDKSPTGLTVEAVGPEAAGSQFSLKVWVADRPQQAELLSKNDRIAVLNTSDAEPRLLVAVEHREESS